MKPKIRRGIWSMSWGGWGAAAAALALLVVAALAGCAAKRQLVVHGTGLSADTLRAGGLAVVGVTVVDEVEQVRPPLVQALEKELGSSRADLPFRSAAAVRESLGLQAYRRLLLAYQSAGKLTYDELAELRGGMGTGARFALLARVEKNAVRVAGLATQGDSQYGTSNSFVPYQKVSRDARVRVTLYDLADRSTAWEAVYASSSDNEVPDSLLNRPRRVTFDAPGASSDPHDGIPDYPSAPSLAEALAEAFRAFTADLPGAPKATGATPAPKGAQPTAAQPAPARADSAR